MGAAIHDTHLTGVPDTLLSQTKLIAIAVTADEYTDIGQTADLQVQLRQNNFRIGTVFRPDWGWEFDYGPGNTDLSRTALEPLWGAWHPVVFAACGLGVIILPCPKLGRSWLSFILRPPKPPPGLPTVKLDGPRRRRFKLIIRRLDARLPPSSFSRFALYGYQEIDLIGLACFFAGHFLVGWIYIASAVPFLERTLSPPPPKTP